MPPAGRRIASAAHGSAFRVRAGSWQSLPATIVARASTFQPAGNTAQLIGSRKAPHPDEPVKPLICQAGRVGEMPWSSIEQGVAMKNVPRMTSKASVVMKTAPPSPTPTTGKT